MTHFGPKLMLRECGVYYFRDQVDRIYKGWHRLDYVCIAPSGEQYINHVYVEGQPLNRALKQLQKLCNHWTQGGWHYYF